MTTGDIPGPVQALAQGDFTQVADAFANAGFAVRLPVPGILQITLPDQLVPRQRVLISVGLHGDETAPIEIVAQLLENLAAVPHELAVDLLVVVGNLAAITAGKRFIDADLNRMFTEERGALQSAAEAVRADLIMRATVKFFAGQAAPKWHLDLHTAIRPSLYPAFAIVPESGNAAHAEALLPWLGQAGIEAAILNRTPASTFSSWTARRFAVAACTTELGQIAVLGTNDLNRFSVTRTAVDNLLRGAQKAGDDKLPLLFEVAQELIKHTEAFSMTVPGDAPNFTPLAPGSIVAQDGAHVSRVGVQTEYIVFPNPNVRVGLRAGLLVVQCPSQ